MNISDEAIAAVAGALLYRMAGISTLEASATEQEMFMDDARVALKAAAPFLIESLATEAFKDKKIQGLQRVFIGNWLRARA